MYLRSVIISLRHSNRLVPLVSFLSYLEHLLRSVSYLEPLTLLSSIPFRFSGSWNKPFMALSFMNRTSLKNQLGCSWYSTLYSMLQINHVMFPYHVFLDHTDDRSRCTTFKVKSIMSFGTWKAVCSKYYLCFVRLWKTPLSSISLRHFDTSRIFPRVSHFVRGC